MMSENILNEAVYLVMQGEQVFWFKCIDGRITDTFVDRIGNDELVQRSRCPWINRDLNNAELEVHLILNTVLDELDHVTIEDTSTGFFSRINRYRCVRQLRHDHAQATVYNLPIENSPRIASLLHHIISEDWSAWLVGLQKRNVIIVGIATATELLAHWSRSVNQALLLDMSVGDERRHLLVSKGVPLFMRVISNSGPYTASSGSASPVNATKDSLEIISGTLNLAVETVPVAELIAEEDCPSPEWRDARAMVLLMAGKKLPLLFQYADMDNTTDVEQAMICQSQSSVSNANSISRLRRLLFASEKSLVRKNYEWSPRRNTWLAMDALGSSVQQLQTLARISQLKVVTVMFAVMGLILFFGASVHGIKGVILRDNLRTQQQSNTAAVEELTQSANSIHDSPVAVARSMQMLNEFRAASVAKPETVVATIAGALAAVPAVSLDALIWTTVSDKEYRDDIYSSVNALEVRRQYWRTEPELKSVNVEIAGVVSGDDLSDQKHSLDRFISKLEDRKEVLRVTILESPVDAALKSELINRQSSQFRVSVYMEVG